MPIRVTRHPLSTASGEAAGAVTGFEVDGETIERLRSSFAHFESRGDELSSRFYDTLFARFPNLRAMFPSDMTAQRRKLFDALRAVVDNLAAPRRNRDLLEQMGARHAGYGTRPEHYPLVRETLVDAMASCAGAAWSGAHREDWAAAIDLIGEIMLQGAAKAEGARG